jgi:hypothetical protein
MKGTTLLAGFLLLLSSFLFSNCTAERDFVSTPREIIAQGSWGVKSLYAGSEQAGQYAAYSFTFGPGGTVRISANGETTTGAWRWVRNVQSEVLQLQLPDHSSLPVLNAQWTLQQWGLHTMTLTKGNDVLTLEQLSGR